MGLDVLATAAVPGIHGDLEICPGPGYVVSILANMDPPAAGHLSDFITNRLPGR